MHLKMSTIHHPPWVIINESNDIQEFTGALVDLVKYTSKALNYTYTLTDTVHMGVGKVVNNSWTGMIGTLLRNEVDMILLPFLKTEERLSYLVFTSDVTYAKTQILSGKPSEIHDNSLQGLVDVSSGVIFLLLLFWISVSTLVYFIDRHEYKYQSKRGLRSPEIQSFLWMFYASIFSKAFLRDWRNLSSRIMVSFWWVFIVILISAISGSMKAHIMVLKENRIDSIEDILRNPDLIPMIKKDTGYQQFFEESERTDVKLLWQQIQRTGGLCTEEEIFENSMKLAMSERVYIAGYDDISYYLDVNCNPSLENSFYIGNEALSTMSVGIPVSSKLDKTFVQKFNNRIGSFLGNLLVTEYFRNMDRRSFKCYWAVRENVGFQYTLAQANNLFRVYGLGIFIATFVAITERLLTYDIKPG